MSGRGRKSEHTFHWHGFKFCEIKQGDVGVGWEAHCPHHSVGTTRCTRSLRWAPNGGAPIVQRNLYWWALQAASCADRAEHMAVPKRGADDDEGMLPTQETLDAAAAAADEPAALSDS